MYSCGSMTNLQRMLTVNKDFSGGDTVKHKDLK